MAKTISVPVELMRRAEEKAKARDWNLSGFARYCMALQCDYTEQEALDMGTHGAVIVAREREVRYPPHKPQNLMLNNDPSSVAARLAKSSAGSAAAKARDDAPAPKPKSPTGATSGGKS